MIKAIETHYNGYKFRSRLEARWAVFFDEIGAEWEYEPEGFVLSDGTTYLPDFRVKNVRGRGVENNGDSIWIEVKGELTNEDLHKIKLFANEDEYGVPTNKIIIFGNIPDESLNFCFDDQFYSLEFSEPDTYWTIPKSGKGGGLVLDYPDDPYDFVDEERTKRAYEKARQARFEHGEKPKQFKRESFVFYKSFYDMSLLLDDDKKRLDFLMAVVRYGLFQEEPKFDDVAMKIAFVHCRTMIDVSSERYRKKQEENNER